MADKTYKMTVGLSDGSSLNAGNFIVPQGEAGGSAYGGYNNVTSNNTIPLAAFVNTASNPNCFCVNFISTNLNTFRLMYNNTTLRSNLVYLQITRNPANLHWELYLGITSSLSGELGFVFGSVSGFNPDNVIIQSNEGNNTIKIYFQAFKT